jgi:hypothetical protein
MMEQCKLKHEEELPVDQKQWPSLKRLERNARRWRL